MSEFIFGVFVEPMVELFVSFWGFIFSNRGNETKLSGIEYRTYKFIKPKVTKIELKKKMLSIRKNRKRKKLAKLEENNYVPKNDQK
jgi:hypothetical protein